jgi:Leucine-rich repeat (LRR) protein
MFPDMTPSGMESLTNRSHVNSVNGRTETGLTNISEGSELDLKDKSLSTIPKEMFTFKLKSINLSGNNLAQFPDSLCECFNLKYLYLQNNKIRHIPSAIGKLTKLKFLCIHSNKLQEIPRELGECTQMSKLSLKDNEFSSLPSSLGNMQNLKVFEIEWFKYCIPAIRILGKDGKIKSESMQS